MKNQEQTNKKNNLFLYILINSIIIFVLPIVFFNIISNKISIEKNNKCLTSYNDSLGSTPGFSFLDKTWTNAHGTFNDSIPSFTDGESFDISMLKDKYLFQFSVADWKDFPTGTGDNDGWISYRDALSQSLVSPDLKMGLGSNDSGFGKINITQHNPGYGNTWNYTQDTCATTCADYNANDPKNPIGNGNQWEWTVDNIQLSTNPIINPIKGSIKVWYTINDNKSLYDLLQVRRISNSSSPDRNGELETRCKEDFSFTLSVEFIYVGQYTSDWKYGTFYNGDDTKQSEIKTLFSTKSSMVSDFNAIYIHMDPTGFLHWNKANGETTPIKFDVDNMDDDDVVDELPFKVEQYDGTFVQKSKYIAWWETYNAHIANINISYDINPLGLTVNNPTLNIGANMDFPTLNISYPTITDKSKFTMIGVSFDIVFCRNPKNPNSPVFSQSYHYTIDSFEQSY